MEGVGALLGLVHDLLGRLLREVWIGELGFEPGKLRLQPPDLLLALRIAGARRKAHPALRRGKWRAFLAFVHQFDMGKSGDQARAGVADFLQMNLTAARRSAG